MRSASATHGEIREGRDNGGGHGLEAGAGGGALGI
jgi:hypothetical protein